MTPVFVYGTLKPGESNYQHYCRGKVIAETPAYIWGKLYHLSLGYPAITPGKNKIEGWLLTFEDDKILTSLDLLEGYQTRRSPQLNEYYRQQIPVYGLSGESLGLAWCYLMSQEKIQQYHGVLLSIQSWTMDS